MLRTNQSIARRLTEHRDLVVSQRGLKRTRVFNDASLSPQPVSLRGLLLGP